MGTSRSQDGHQRFCWMRVWHSAWSWLKLIVAAESVAGKTRTGMFTRLILRNPFHVGRAAISPRSVACPKLPERLTALSVSSAPIRTTCTILHETASKQEYHPHPVTSDRDEMA